MEAFKDALGRLFGDSRVGDCEAAISAGATQSFGWPGWSMPKWTYNVSGTNQATSDVVKLIGSFLNPPVGGGSMAARGRSMLAGLKNLSKTGWVLVLLLVLAVLFVYYQLDQIVWRGVYRGLDWAKPRKPGSGTALLIKVAFKVPLSVAAETVSTVARGVQSVASGVGSGLGSSVRGARTVAGLAVNSVRAGARAVSRAALGNGNQKFGSDSSDYTLRDVDELALGSDASASRESLSEVDWNATMLAVQDACIYVTDPSAATATATTIKARAHAQNAVAYQAGVLRDAIVVSGERGSAYIQVRDALRAAWPYATEVTHAQAAESMRKTIDILVERAQRTRDVMVGATGIGLGQIARLLLRSAAGKEHAVPKADLAWSAHVEDARVLLDLREESERVTRGAASGEASAGRARGCIFPVACDGKGNYARTDNARKAGNGTATAGTLCKCMKLPLESRLLCREHTAKIRGKMQEMQETWVASRGTIEGALIAWLVAELAGGELKDTGIKESDDAERQMLAEMRAASLWLPAKAREVPSFGKPRRNRNRRRGSNAAEVARPVEAAKQAEAAAALGIVGTQVARLEAATGGPAAARVATVAAGAVSKFTPAEEGFIEYHKANGTSQASLETDVLNKRVLRKKLRDRFSSVSVLSEAVDGIIADLEKCEEEAESGTLADATRIVTLLANADANPQTSPRVLLGLANKAFLNGILAKAHTEQSQSRGTVCVPAGTVCAMINRHLPAFLAHQEPERHADLAEVAELLVGVISAVESGIDAANDVSSVIGALRVVQSNVQDVGGNRPSDAQVGAFIQALEHISTCTILYCEREGGEGGQGGLPDLLGGLASLGSSRCRLAVAWLSAKLVKPVASPAGDSGSTDPTALSSAFGIDFLKGIAAGGARLANSALGAGGTVLEYAGDIADFTEAVTGCSAEIEKRALVFVKLFVNLYHVLVSDNVETIKTTSTFLSAVKLSALSAEEQATIAEANGLLKARQAGFGMMDSVDQALDQNATLPATPATPLNGDVEQGRVAAKSRAGAAGAYIASIWRMIVEFFVAIPGHLLALAKKGAGNGGSVTNLFGDLAQLLLEKIRGLVQEATAKLANGSVLEWGDILSLFSAGGAGALKCAYEIRTWLVGDEGLLSILRNPLSVLKGNPLNVGRTHLKVLSYAVAAAVLIRFAQLIALFGTEMQDAIKKVIGDAAVATAHAGTTIKAGVTNLKSYFPAKAEV